MSDSREFPNTYPDYDGSTSLFDASTGRLRTDIEATLSENTLALLQVLEKRLSTEIDTSDHSVYTGPVGIALLYLHLTDVKPLKGARDFLKDARTHIEPVLPHLKKKHFSFMCGVPGPLAIGSVILDKSGMDMDSKDLYMRLENLDRDVISGDLPDELLYGRVGYLFSLLFLQKHLGRDETQDQIIKRVVASILKSGKHWAKKTKNAFNFPLYYEWHDKPYLGIAHGFAGILYMLLQAKDYMSPDDLSTLVRPSLDLLMSLQFPSGNFPSSLGNSSDRLVHWCHGAPGMIHLQLLAHQVFEEEMYVTSARKCSDIIWTRGLLRKGYGLCHGVAGNGYAHLRLFQVTKDERYLHRALKFAEWCYDYGKHGCRTPDRPLSLFEGLAGTVYFLSDLLEPLNSAFPAFQLL